MMKIKFINIRIVSAISTLLSHILHFQVFTLHSFTGTILDTSNPAQRARKLRTQFYMPQK